MKDCRDIKNDILKKDDKLTSNEVYHNLILTIRSFFPKRKYNKNFNYDIASYPMDYLKGLIIINVNLEKYDKSFHAIPIRKTFYPKNVRFDTSSIIRLMTPNGSKVKMLKNIIQYKEFVWNQTFNMDYKLFKRKLKYYKISGSLVTDGVSASITFIRNDLEDIVENDNILSIENINDYLNIKSNKWKEYEIQRDKHKQEMKESGKKVKNYVDKIDLEKVTYFNTIKKDKYITECKNISKDIKIIAIDPNKENLIYAVDENDKIFKYTNGRRRVESKTLKYTDLRLKFKRENKKFDVSIEEWETILSNHNSKTCDFIKCQNYIKDKLYCFLHLRELYSKLPGNSSKNISDLSIRKLNLNRYMNMKRSEDLMLNRFQEFYSDENELLEPKNTIVAIGDYSSGSYHIKHKNPAMSVRTRKLFKDRGYNVFLVDEYKTSKICNKCNECLHKFIKRPVRKKKEKDKNEFMNQVIKEKEVKNVLAHGVLSCNDKNGCNTIWARDLNASLNILKITKNEILEYGRPEVFSRYKFGSNENSSNHIVSQC